jgi:hypothetical protein
MTPQEHYFVMMLQARQNAKFNVLYEALKASGVVQPDDLEAYRLYMLEEKPEKAVEWIEKTWKAYQSTAVSLGITTGLEGGPFPPT